MNEQRAMLHPANLSIALKGACYLAATDALTWPERAEAVRALAAQLYRGRRAVRLPFAGGRLLVDALHEPDWRVYRGVFVRKEYAADCRNSVVVDVGAHRGFFAAMALMRGCATLLAYEPEPVNLEFLRANVREMAGPGQQAHVHPEAVGMAGGTASFYAYDESWSHSVVERPDKQLVSSLEVDQTAFADVVEQAVVKARPGQRVIVKIDAEGIEYEVLMAASPETLAAIDELFVETHDYVEGSPAALAGRLAAEGLRPAPQAASAGKHDVRHFVRAAPAR